LGTSDGTRTTRAGIPFFVFHSTSGCTMSANVSALNMR
jgi:hypothetical protein